MKANETAYCPLCGEAHEASIVRREAETLIKGQLVRYEERVAWCGASEEDGDTYVTASLSRGNLLAARDAYRAGNGLLTSGEIVALRKKYGLTQAELAKLLGWGEVTVTRYETKAIQDEAHDSLLRIVRDSPMELLRFAEKNKDSVPIERFEALKKKIADMMEHGGSEALRRQAVQSAYLPFASPSELNGNRAFDEASFAAAVTYLASRVRHLYKTRLMKMLWYADSLAYREQGSSITGLVYCHRPMGALPVAHNDLMLLESVNVKEEECEDGSVRYLVEPCERTDLEILDKEERAVLDRVVERFKYCNAAGIVEAMHRERAYLETKPGEIISYKFAKDIEF